MATQVCTSLGMSRVGQRTPLQCYTTVPVVHDSCNSEAADAGGEDASCRSSYLVMFRLLLTPGVLRDVLRIMLMASVGRRADGVQHTRPVWIMPAYR
jgi:hypothetical protein